MTTAISRADLKPLVYSDSKARAKAAETLFKDVLEFKSVEICTNFSKQDIIARLGAIKAEASEFERENQDQSVFLVSIVWIGFKLNHSK